MKWFVAFALACVPGLAVAAATDSTTTAAKPKDAPKWDVANPPGPWKDIPIDVTEGTWMSVDVSPQGDAIVFDFLGDLYEIPMAGGEAKALTSGIAWDEQPRYSPDGKHIAFTSDRAGGDNIWIMKRDGSDPKQVTKEKFRLLNSPDWTPDGDYIVARKHFTSTRSAGAGEMWLYHRTGGEGVQMTKRPNDQKDVGEPAFSPDGRYLYYSQDVTPGSTFQYNKDPNTQIYAIQQLDRETGDTQIYAGGSGGAIRPTPSPDGQWVAFIRRVRGKSVLHRSHVRSGIEEPLFDGLDRDLQETWAIHGVYPGMAWTPDSRALVFWADGRIQRLDVATKKAITIPFHVRDTRKIRDALRFPVSVAPDRFHTKMLRWVQVSPRGDRVLYQALGFIWVRELPNGTPRRLTKQQEHFEFYPTWSRDGQSIAYVSWDDDSFGAVRVAPARGGEGRVVTQDPGHYVEPLFTPDGTRIVYRATRDGYLTSPAWGRETGIFVVPARGGAAPVRVTRKGASPQFGAASDRVYLIEVGGDDGDDRTLFSVELDGSDERKHLHGVYFTDVRIAPDEKWVAFTEKWNVHVAPLVRTGKAVDIGPGSSAYPTQRVSRDAGENLHWSGDSKRLHWTMGPELFSRSLPEAFAFVDGAPEKLPDPPAAGIDVGFDVAADVPTGKLAFTGARIVTLRGDEVIDNGTLIVERNRIVAVGANLSVPAGAKIMDARGATIIPGLVDVHWHGSMGSDEIQPEQSWVHYASLAFGVTTIHDPSNDTSEIFSAAEMARAGQIVAPRIFSTGTILYGAKGDFKAEVDSLGDAIAHLRRMRAAGAISVKSYNQPRRDQRQQVIEAGAQLGMMVVPEGGSLWQHNMTMIVDGHTGVEHSIPLARVYADVVQLWSQSRVGYTPTLGVGYGGIWGENYWYGHTQVWANGRLLSFVPRQIVDARSRRPFIAPDEEYGYLYNARGVKKLHDAGVSVQLGAHGQREGLAAHWEIWMFQQGGMTPMQALRCGSLKGAEYIGMDRDIGSLEVGKLADFAVLDRNPLDDIRNTDSVRWTVVNGRVFDAHTMDELGNHPRKRGAFFFERTGGAVQRTVDLD
jgi:imidazolonepropionase-like amidohydrolase/Tol biopolymer transport system component